MTEVTDPYTLVANAIEEVLKEEFLEENFPIRHDRLHESIGYKGTVIGISPEREVADSENYLVNQMTVLVQFYGRYNLEVDNEQRVDPRKITNYAERFRRAIRDSAFQGNEVVWFFNVLGVEYPKDATGNKTRFEATILAYGANSVAVETTL